MAETAPLLAPLRPRRLEPVVGQLLADKTDWRQEAAPDPIKAQAFPTP